MCLHILLHVDTLDNPKIPLRSAYETWMANAYSACHCKHYHYGNCNPVKRRKTLIKYEKNALGQKEIQNVNRNHIIIGKEKGGI